MSTTRPSGLTDAVRRDPMSRAPEAAARFVARTLLEVAIIGVLFVAYNLGRLAIQGQEHTALHHADMVRRIEGLIHLPSEAELQDAIAAVPHLFELANQYYVTLHFPVMIAFLLWTSRPADASTSTSLVPGAGRQGRGLRSCGHQSADGRVPPRPTGRPRVAGRGPPAAHGTERPWCRAAVQALPTSCARGGSVASASTPSWSVG